MSPNYAPSISRAIELPWCPKCSMQMDIARIEPDGPGFDRRTFECPTCQHSENTVAQYLGDAKGAHPTEADDAGARDHSITRYVALVDGKDGAWSLTVPDLPGCTSAGSTITEVLNNAAEAVRLWLNDARIAPRPYDDVVADEKVKAAIVHGAMPAIVLLAPVERPELRPGPKDKGVKN
jgi:predicted RNase H-like HicB family nuclease